ncbi:MAG: hypothetical protein JXA49_11205 [Actinobacteria bacterium]|nr:hypothetical protein [Actinomycetota bacterium]
MRSVKQSRVIGKTALICVLILAAFMSLTLSTPCSAENDKPYTGKVVVIVIDRVGPGDFPSDATPFCRGLADEWSFGLMVTRVAYETTPEDSLGADYVTLGAGVRSRGAKNAGLSFGADEIYAGYRGPATAGEYYSLYSGRVPSKEGIVSLGWNEVLRSNETGGNDNNAGLLGDLLADDHRKIAVIGNADTIFGPMRLAPLACCDSVGRVPYGNVGNGYTVPSPDTTGGYRIDPGILAATTIEYLEKTDVVFVDTGDTARIDAGYLDTGKEQLERERIEALGRVDTAVETIAGALDLDSSLLLIVTPRAPFEARGNGNFLTPVIAAGKGFGDGLVTSTTTRKTGLVDNSDFLPTVLEFFRIKSPSSVNGNPMSCEISDASPGELGKINEQFGVTRKARWPISIIGALIMLALATLTVLSMLRVRGYTTRPRKPLTAARVVSPVSIVLLTFPLAIIISASFGYDNYLFPTVFCLLFSTVAGLSIWKVQSGRKRMDPLVSVSLLTAGVIAVDLLMGEGLISIAPLGSTSLEGMRYFGFTNTVASILLACTVWAVAGIAGEEAFKPGRVRVLLLICMGAVSLLTGLGIFGANIGGFITSVTTFLVYIYTGSRKRISRLMVVSIPVIAVAGLSVIVLLDALFFHSHAGKAATTGSGQILGIISRKIAIQINAMKGLSIPIMVVVIAILGFVVWMRRDDSQWFDDRDGARPRFAAFYSLLTGGLVAVMTNDTGFLMLGFMMAYSVICACFYASEWMLNEHSPSKPGGVTVSVIKY